MKFATLAIALFAASGVNAFVADPNARAKTSLLSYLDDLGAKAKAAPRKGIANYLDTVSTAPVRAGGAGITSFVSTVATNSNRAAGGGITSYLDTINQACDAIQSDTTKCAEAISDYMGALSSGEAP